MFQIGDKVFYPMHGAGIIESIEEREILGEIGLYYIMKMAMGNMKVMIPRQKADHLLIREVVNSAILEEVVAILQQKGDMVPEVNSPYQQRQRINMDKMKSGDIFEGAQVIYELSYLNKAKKLGIAEKTMLDNAKQMLISELVLVKGIDEYQAVSLINH